MILDAKRPSAHDFIELSMRKSQKKGMTTMLTQKTHEVKAEQHKHHDSA
jgi:hypothetical protein